MSTSPVNGNQYFTHTSNLAAQLDHINVNEANLGTVTANSVNAGFVLASQSSSVVGKTIRVVKGYVPTGSLPLTFGTAYFLNANSGGTSQTTVANGVLQLPAGATIVGAFYNDPTAAGPTALNIGTSAIGGAAVTNNNIFAAMPLATAVAGGSAGVFSGTPTALGGAGGIGNSTTVSVSATAATGVSLTVTVANLTASSGVLTLYYYV